MSWRQKKRAPRSCRLRAPTQGPSNLNQMSILEDFVNIRRLMPTKWTQERIHVSNKEPWENFSIRCILIRLWLGDPSSRRVERLSTSSCVVSPPRGCKGLGLTSRRSPQPTAHPTAPAVHGGAHDIPPHTPQRGPGQVVPAGPAHTPPWGSGQSTAHPTAPVGVRV